MDRNHYIKNIHVIHYNLLTKGANLVVVSLNIINIFNLSNIVPKGLYIEQLESKYIKQSEFGRASSSEELGQKGALLPRPCQPENVWLSEAERSGGSQRKDGSRGSG